MYLNQLGFGNSTSGNAWRLRLLAKQGNANALGIRIYKLYLGKGLFARFYGECTELWAPIEKTSLDTKKWQELFCYLCVGCACDVRQLEHIMASFKLDSYKRIVHL